MENDLFNVYVLDNKKGVLVNGIVIVVDVKGVIIELEDGVEGYICVFEVLCDCIEDVLLILNVGDKVEVKFIGVDCKNCVINLFIKVKDEVEE